MTDVRVIFYLSAAGGAAIAALGAFVLGVRPRTRASTWFGLFGLGFGVQGLVSQGLIILHIPESVRAWAEVPWAMLAGVSLVALALVFPRPLSRDERKDAAIAATVAVVLLGLFVAYRLSIPGRSLVLVFVDIGTAPAWAAAGPFVLLLALRCRRTPDAAFRRQLALTAAGPTLHFAHIAVWGTLTEGRGSILHAEGARLAYQLAASGLFLVIALIWLRAAGGPGGRIARNMSWLTLGVMLVALVAASAGANLGISRILMATFLAYAVLRHQLLGIDVKLRFAISRSTIAAAFVAAFFLASEGAQILFGAGNAWVGLAAAGALVFALAPLQRAAERLAEKAVPLAAPPPGVPQAEYDERSAELYRRSVRFAVRDGRITREEELHLFELADRLGLSAGAAMRLRQEVESESAGGASR